MVMKHLIKKVPLILLAAFFFSGTTNTYYFNTAKVFAAQADQNVVKGKILGISKKAKTISIKAGKATQMVKFDDATQGMEHATKGHSAIIKFKVQGKDKIATVIKPKLAKLPQGVTEIKTEELAKLIASGPKKGNYFLVDSRPSKRYDDGHIPTAVSLPVDKLKESGAAYLPGDAKLKNTLLLFYCGGPT